MSEVDTEACERWADIADRRLLGEELSDDDASFADRHLESCELCGAEARVWDEIEAAEHPLESEKADALVERTLQRVKPPDVSRPASFEDARRRRRMLAGGLAATLALAAAAMIWLRPGAEPTEPLPAPLAHLESVRGDVTITGDRAKNGDEVGVGWKVATARGRACIVWNVSTRACLDEHSSAQITEGGEVELEQGTVVAALDPLPPGERFVVVAGSARVSVKGTIFSVTKGATASDVLVRVHQGVVAAESSTSATRDVTKDQELDVWRGSVRNVPAPLRRRDLEVVGVHLPEPAPQPTAKIDPPPSAASSDPARSKPSAPDAGPSAAEMLKEAQSLRAQGNATGAAAAYRRLQAQHPRSAEAHASRLSLAELMLGPLGDPAGALAAYDAYLRGGGGLRQEARYGRILALRRLGRGSEASAAVDAFVRDYPNSVQARALSSKSADAAP